MPARLHADAARVEPGAVARVEDLQPPAGVRDGEDERPDDHARARRRGSRASTRLPSTNVPLALSRSSTVRTPSRAREAGVGAAHDRRVEAQARVLGPSHDERRLADRAPRRRSTPSWRRGGQLLEARDDDGRRPTRPRARAARISTLSSGRPGPGRPRRRRRSGAALDAVPVQVGAVAALEVDEHVTALEADDLGVLGGDDAVGGGPHRVALGAPDAHDGARELDRRARARAAREREAQPAVGADGDGPGAGRPAWARRPRGRAGRGRSTTSGPAVRQLDAQARAVRAQREHVAVRQLRLLDVVPVHEGARAAVEVAQEEMAVLRRAASAWRRLTVPSSAGNTTCAAWGSRPSTTPPRPRRGRGRRGRR